ncbi:peptide chain release factor 2 [Sneathiella aquimaris]|uniref:peptide chain release factor 2 n=1 Tax=Sneathiella aquimaris TaxID=2599305 RepID=UPI00146B70B7|nr:peptide chain release factor 2 [Sneathiella aquimaris]
MRAEHQAVVDEIKQALGLLRRHLDWENATRRLEELNSLVEDPDLWNDSSKAQALMRERTNLDTAITAYNRIVQDLDDTVELMELSEMEDDEETLGEAAEALRELQVEVDKRRLESMLSGEVDGNDCYLEIHAGAGGTESQDWTQILLRMYMRWAEQHGCKVKTLEESAGEEAGLKSVTIEISGENAYGWLKTESGVHRLVRISPFDSNARRHTSFSSVGVFPVIDDDIDIEIEEKDLRIDTYRASGAGGQHVNRTESAIRITHIPTNVVVQCQNDRSQHKNKASAMKMLKSRLYELELQKREEAAQETRGQQTDIGWGHQIRSYVLHPYQMVKDLRTGVEKGNAQGVLDGDLDDYLAAALSQRVGDGE